MQRVLQYPVCQIVVVRRLRRAGRPAARGLSTQDIEGTGWAVGTMLQPAAGFALAGGRSTGSPTSGCRAEAAGIDPAALESGVREALGDDPGDADRQQAAVIAVEAALAALLPVDDEGLLVNAIVEYVEGDPEVQRVSQVCEKFAITERTLQRLTARRIGLSPKWLIQRRRLHEAAERLREVERPDLARVAADLGYSDQAHFGRDFRAVTGVTPGEFAAEPRPAHD